MKPSEIFRDMPGESIDLQLVKESYWEMEESLADESGHFYTSVDFQSKCSRECAICGVVSHTNEMGDIPRACKTLTCEMLRKFWNIHGDITQFYRHGRAGTNIDEVRNVLASEIKKKYGSQKLSAIPKANRFAFLEAAIAKIR